MRELLLYCSLPILVIFILRNPFVGLVSYVAMNIIRPEMLFWGGSHAAFIFRLVIGVTIISFIMKNREGLVNRALTLELFLVFWVWLAVLASLTFSPYPPHPRAYEFAAEFFKAGILGWLLLGILDSKERILRYQDIVFLCFTLLALWGIEQHFRGNLRLEGLGGAAFRDSNGVASVFVLALPIGLNMALHDTIRKKRLMGLSASLTIILAIIFTQSRGGFVGMCVCLLAFFYHSKHKKKLIITLAVLAIPAYNFISGDYTSRISTIGSENEERDLSAGSRLVLWQAGIMVFKDNPLFGTGFLSFPVAKTPYRDLVQNVDDDLLEYSFRGYKVGHNTYIQALSEGGLFLFVPYSLLILTTFWRNWRCRATLSDQHDVTLLKLLNAVEVSLIGYCTCIIFIDALTSIFLILQILLCTSIRAELNRNTMKGNSPPEIAL